MIISSSRILVGFILLFMYSLFSKILIINMYFYYNYKMEKQMNTTVSIRAARNQHSPQMV